MKRILNIYFIIACLCLQSCEDNFEINKPEFNFVDYQITESTAQKAVYENGVMTGYVNVPVYKVTFNFEESADVISIYPGDIGGEFSYNTGRVAKRTSFDFSFDTNVYFGTQDPKTQFFVMASPDYDGTGDIESIHNATWIDITNMFEIPDRLSTSSEYISTGSVNLLELLEEHGSLSLAFKYIVNNQLEFGEYAAIRIKNWNLFSKFEFVDEDQKLDLNWTLTEGEGVKNGRNSIGANLITLRGNTGYNGGKPTEANKPGVEMKTEAWVISDKFNAGNIDFGADKATVIKVFGDPTLKSYTYTYDKPGEYDVVFMLSNVNVENEKKIYKTVHVSIPESTSTVE